VLLVLYYTMSTRLLCPLSYVSTVWQRFSGWNRF